MRPTGAPERLGRFIREHSAEILATWEAAVRAMPIARDLDRPALIDHIPQLLEQIAQIIGELGAAELRTEIPDRHALARLDEGFDLAQVVDELGALRDCVMGRWTLHEVEPPHIEELRILNQAIDRAVRESVVMFTQARDRTLQAIDRIVTAALESTSLNDLLRRLLAVLLETTAAIDTTAILLREGDKLRVRAAVGHEREVEEGFTLEIGEGFSGRIAATGRSLSIAEASQNPMVKSPILRSAGIRALYGVPLIDSGEVIGVAHMGSRTAAEFSEQDKRMFSTMAARATSAIVQHVLRDASERAAADRKFLDEATRILASSLNYHETLEALAALACPKLADWCVVDLLEDGKLQRVAIAHTDPSKIPMAREWARKYPADPAANRGLFNVIRTGEPELISEITEDMIDRDAVDHERADALRALGLRSVMLIPLTARGRTIGAITMVSTQPNRVYRQADIEHASELGRRAGLAVDNARLYHEAQQAVRVREDILAIVSHDLRNPLGAIDLAASMLILNHGADQRSRKQLEIIRRSADRMEHMISDLLDMASIQAGRLSLELAPEDAASLTTDVLDVHAPIAADKGIELVRDTNLQGVRILADRDRLVQVFGNLIGNSIKFCSAGDRIVMNTWVDGNEVCFQIHDTGPGIPPEELPHIFEPYWSAERHAKKGTGLGLYISKGIVEAHHGRIWVESTPGKRTTFFVAVPRVQG